MEGYSKTEIIKFQKVGCLQALFGLGAGFGPADFKSPVSTDFTTPAWLLGNDSTLFDFRQATVSKIKLTADPDSG